MPSKIQPSLHSAGEQATEYTEQSIGQSNVNTTVGLQDGCVSDYQSSAASPKERKPRIVSMASNPDEDIVTHGIDCKCCPTSPVHVNSHCKSTDDTVLSSNLIVDSLDCSDQQSTETVVDTSLDDTCLPFKVVDSSARSLCQSPKAANAPNEVGSKSYFSSPKKIMKSFSRKESPKRAAEQTVSAVQSAGESPSKKENRKMHASRSDPRTGRSGVLDHINDMVTSFKFLKSPKSPKSPKGAKEGKTAPATRHMKFSFDSSPGRDRQRKLNDYQEVPVTCKELASGNKTDEEKLEEDSSTHSSPSGNCHRVSSPASSSSDRSRSKSPGLKTTITLTLERHAEKCGPDKKHDTCADDVLSRKPYKCTDLDAVEKQLKGNAASSPIEDMASSGSSDKTSSKSNDGYTRNSAGPNNSDYEVPNHETDPKQESNQKSYQFVDGSNTVKMIRLRQLPKPPGGTVSTTEVSSYEQTPPKRTLSLQSNGTNDQQLGVVSVKEKMRPPSLQEAQQMNYTVVNVAKVDSKNPPVPAKPSNITQRSNAPQPRLSKYNHVENIKTYSNIHSPEISPGEPLAEKDFQRGSQARTSFPPPKKTVNFEDLEVARQWQREAADKSFIRGGYGRATLPEVQHRQQQPENMFQKQSNWKRVNHGTKFQLHANQPLPAPRMTSDPRGRVMSSLTRIKEESPKHPNDISLVAGRQDYDIPYSDTECQIPQLDQRYGYMSQSYPQPTRREYVSIDAANLHDNYKKRHAPVRTVSMRTELPDNVCTVRPNLPIRSQSFSPTSRRPYRNNTYENVARVPTFQTDQTGLTAASNMVEVEESSQLSPPKMRYSRSSPVKFDSFDAEHSHTALPRSQSHYSYAEKSANNTAYSLDAEPMYVNLRTERSGYLPPRSHRNILHNHLESSTYTAGNYSGLDSNVRMSSSLPPISFQRTDSGEASTPEQRTDSTPSGTSECNPDSGIDSPRSGSQQSFRSQSQLSNHSDRKDATGKLLCQTGLKVFIYCINLLRVEFIQTQVYTHSVKCY